MDRALSPSAPLTHLPLVISGSYDSMMDEHSVLEAALSPRKRGLLLDSSEEEEEEEKKKKKRSSKQVRPPFTEHL